jgi:succinate dehydrogenase / fumarate reductase cytochrome b subunit
MESSRTDDPDPRAASTSLFRRRTRRPFISVLEEGPVVKAPAGTLYRGREGMWSWVAHRVTGVLIFFFLLVHVLDTALVRLSPEAYNTVIGTYKNPVVGLGEVGLVGAILFHALNGLRVMAVDFWSNGPRRQRQMLWTVLVVWAVLFAGFTVRHLMHVFGE